jgi:uncharacterized membrane protein YczE
VLARQVAGRAGRSRWARLVLLVVGGALIAAGVSGLLWTRLGPGPLDVFITAVVERSGVPITFVVWGVALAMITTSVLLGRRPGPGTLLLPFVSGSLLPVFMGVLDRWSPPTGLHAVTLLAHVAAIAVVGVGAGAIGAAGLGQGFGELVATAASVRVRRPEALVRTGMELSWLALGLLLGGTAGVGTVLVALLIGPAVRSGYRGVLGALESQPGRLLRARLLAPLSRAVHRGGARSDFASRSTATRALRSGGSSGRPRRTRGR